VTGLTVAGLILKMSISSLIMLFTADSTATIELTCRFGSFIHRAR
jgi:hypothetical protein